MKVAQHSVCACRDKQIQSVALQVLEPLSATRLRQLWKLEGMNNLIIFSAANMTAHLIACSLKHIFHIHHPGWNLTHQLVRRPTSGTT